MANNEVSGSFHVVCTYVCTVYFDSLSAFGLNYSTRGPLRHTKEQRGVENSVEVGKPHKEGIATHVWIRNYGLANSDLYFMINA